MTVTKRIKVRVPDIAPAISDELITTASDRLLLRIGEDNIPARLESVLVEVVVAMYNRMYHEGIKSEAVESLTTAFVDDLFTLYEDDISAYLARRESEANENRGKLMFL